MCGFAGIYNIDGSAIDTSLLHKMTQVIRHRGPDDEGYLIASYDNGNSMSYHHHDTADEVKSNTRHLSESMDGNLGFGFRRLSIIDLSADAHQPMKDSDHNLWIIFNGEIYNYVELKKELVALGHTFRSHSDTEVILKAYVQWGRDCVKRFNGMWGFVVWDAEERSLFCSRDRFGIKPFYYYHLPGKLFVFASEIKSILQAVKPEINYATLSEYLTTYHHDHTNETFFKDIHQLSGAHCLTVNSNSIESSRYYDVQLTDNNYSNADYQEQFREVFFDAVKVRLRSDVPLGYALSGGIDSSSIVVAAKAIGKNSSNSTFSSVYPNHPADESVFIDEVIAKTNFTKHSITPTPEELIKEMDLFQWHQEEPISGTSYYAEFCLRRLIKETGVTVSLEGQGADEIITGYTSLIVPYLQELLVKGKILGYLREFKNFKGFAGLNPLIFTSNFIYALNPSLYENWRNKYRKSTAVEYNHQFLDQFHINKVDDGKKQSKSLLNHKLYELLMYHSIPPQLIRADKSAMAFSVECRFPFLDYRLVDLAFSIPSNMKIRNGVTKYVLRESMKAYLPSKVYNRHDKKGFPTPQENWLRNEMKDFISDIIHSEDFKSLPFINWKEFEKKYEYYLVNGGDFNVRLWLVVGVYLWMKRFNLK